MAEKGGTWIIAIVTILTILFSVSFSGCVEDEESSYYPKEEDIELKLSMNKQKFEINDTTVRINLTLKNISQKILKTEYSFSIDTFIDVWIETPTNNTIRPNIYPSDPARVKITLKPNEILKENFLLFGYIWLYSYINFQWISGNYTIYSNYQYYEMQKIESIPLNFKVI
jgi:hypothetical protein